MDGSEAPACLVSSEWVAGHAHDDRVRIVEVDVDTSAYAQGHVPGAVAWNWTTDLCDRRVRDIVSRSDFTALLGTSGIDNETVVVLYGDNHNWFAAWAFWQLEIYGHPAVRIMDGGRQKWLDEGRPLSRDTPVIQPRTYLPSDPDWSLRAYRRDVEAALGQPDVALVDVRSPQEFTGEILAPPSLPESCQRGGHIPGATNIPWGRACNEDGTFRTLTELSDMYRGLGVTPDKQVISYCRIGERSSHTWFVLRHLLGYPRVRNYDGSWTEWGNLVGAVIER